MRYPWRVEPRPAARSVRCRRSSDARRSRPSTLGPPGGPIETLTFGEVEARTTPDGARPRRARPPRRRPARRPARQPPRVPRPLPGLPEARRDLRPGQRPLPRARGRPHRRRRGARGRRDDAATSRRLVPAGDAVPGTWTSWPRKPGGTADPSSPDADGAPRDDTPRPSSTPPAPPAARRARSSPTATSPPTRARSSRPGASPPRTATSPSCRSSTSTASATASAPGSRAAAACASSSASSTSKAEALFEEFRPTLFFGVPTMYVRLLELPRRGGPTDRRADAALRLRLGAAARHRLRGLPREVRPRHPRALRDDRDADDDRQPVRRRAAAGTVGRPLPGVEVRIVGPDGRDVPEGETGQLLVRGPAVFDGYWRQPEATARRVRGRLVPHRRPRRALGRRLRHAPRPRERPHHQRRLQRLPARDRGGPARAAGRARGGGPRRARRAPGRGARRLLRRRGRPGRARGRLPPAARVVQGAAVVRARRRAAPQRHGQGGQGAAAGGAGEGDAPG